MLTAAAKKKVAQQVKSSQAASRKMRATVAAADRGGRLSTPTKRARKPKASKPRKRG
jgi:hypothetical protein